MNFTVEKIRKVRARLAPRFYQSEEHCRRGGITKQGNKWVRWALVQAPRHDPKLRLFFERVAARRGKKKAIVALARKILCIIHHLLINGRIMLRMALPSCPT